MTRYRSERERQESRTSRQEDRQEWDREHRNDAEVHDTLDPDLLAQSSEDLRDMLRSLDTLAMFSPYPDARAGAASGAAEIRRILTMRDGFDCCW